MADSGLKTVLGLAVVGAVGYFAYTSGLLNSLLGIVQPSGTTPPPSTGSGAGTSTTTTTGTTGSGAGTNPAPPPAPPAPPYPLGPAGPCTFSGVLAPTLAFAQKANPTLSLGPSGSDTLNMDQWGYYLNEVCTNLSAQAGLDPGVIFPGDANRGGGLNWNAFAGYAKGQGLSGRRVSGVGGTYLRRAA